MQGVAKHPGGRYDGVGVAASVTGQELRDGESEAAHGSEMMIGDQRGLHGSNEAGDGCVVRCDESFLRAGEGFVSGATDAVRALVERVGKRPAADQPEPMADVDVEPGVGACGVDGGGNRGGVEREQAVGLVEVDQWRLVRGDEGGERVKVEGVRVRPAGRQGEEAESASEIGGGVVAALVRVDGDDRAAWRAGEPGQSQGHRVQPGQRADGDVGGAGQLPHHRDRELGFHHRSMPAGGKAPVRAVGVGEEVSVGGVGDQRDAGERGHAVLRRDQREGVPGPLLLAFQGRQTIDDHRLPAVTHHGHRLR